MLRHPCNPWLFYALFAGQEPLFWNTWLSTMSKWKCIWQKLRLKAAQSQAYCPVLNHLNDQYVIPVPMPIDCPCCHCVCWSIGAKGHLGQGTVQCRVHEVHQYLGVFIQCPGSHALQTSCLGHSKNNEANVLQNGPKNHISLIHFSRINSLHAIFLSCLIIFGVTLIDHVAGR